MKAEIIFKISTLVLLSSSFFLNYMTGGWEYSGDIMSAMEWHGFNSQIQHWFKLSIVGPLQLAALVMLSYNLIARNIFAALSFVGLLVSLFEGVAAYSELEIFIVQLYYLCTGVSITLSFTTLSGNFRSPFSKKTLRS
ncbi:hypothetical protein [Gallaecimonas sp. GXIMD4217]|uniref:hypothetical protein n=1 Tax=Gallaecimonas sp. GXIMD4217 TaxID=3131927 RepID=UPI00311B1141